MMDDSDLNSDPATSMLTAMDELWQNQTYLPIKGWGAPFTGPDHYTDLSGEKSFSNWDFPDLPPLPGWKWTTKWTVDISGSFGQTDSDGWCYETTFDRLIDSIKANAAHGSNVTTSIVRRRRYIRMRTCVTAEATAQMRARTTALLEIRNKFEIALREKKTDYALTMQYERERKRLCGDSWAQLSDGIRECHNSIQSNISKLEYIKQYYQEIAEAERDYSRRLHAICSKSAKYESSRPSGAADEPEEEKAEGQAPAPAHYLFECGDTKAAIAEFYTEMNATNTTVSRGLIDVANMITEDIFKVIDSNVKDMKMLLQDLKDDISHIDNYKVKEEAVVKSLAKLDSSFYAIAKADEDEILRLSKVISGEMTDDPAFLEALSRSAKTGEPVNTDVYSYFYAGASRDGEDMWAAHYVYRQAVQSCWESFNHLEKSVNKATLMKVQCNQATCIVLTSTRRMFMKEQGTVWAEAFPPGTVAASDMVTEEREKAGSLAIDADAASIKSFGSEGLTPLSESGDTGTESFVFERQLPILPACTSVLKEGPIRYCSGEETRKAVVSMTTNLGGASPGGSKAVTGIPWQRLWGILSSDGVVHVLSNEDEKEGGSTEEKRRTLLKSIPVKGSEIIIHSSDFGLFPLMIEVVPKSGSLMDSVMQGSGKKDAYMLGSNDKETEDWFTAIMHPVIGAVYARGGAEAKTMGTDKKGAAAAMKSPHRKNSLTPGSSSAMAAAATATSAATGGQLEEEFMRQMEVSSTAGEASGPSASEESKAFARTEAQAAAPGEPNSGSSAVSASPSADTALKRSESALLEAARLAEGWRFSETEDLDGEDGDVVGDDEERNEGDEDA